MNRICRACLGEQENMESLFDNENQHMFNFCTSLNIDKTDRLPKLICNHCKTELNRAYAFKQQCINSQATCERNLTECAQNIEHYDNEDVSKIQNYTQNCNDNNTVNTDDDEDNAVMENEMLELENLNEIPRKRKKLLEHSFACEICSEGFNTDEDLQIHMIAHPENDDPTCSLCNKQFNSLKVLKRHVRIHMKNKPFKCELCNKSFPESGSLTRHLRKHRGEKRHLCTVCGKGFYEANVLVVHMRTHTGEKPIECMMCNKRFSDPNGLRSHLKSHTGEKNYVCNICNKSFSHSFVLKKHLRVHSGERPYLCSVCGKSFTQSHYVSVHMRQHTGEQPYTCQVCNKGFTQNSQLEMHMRVHTGVKPYICAMNHKKCVVPTCSSTEKSEKLHSFPSKDRARQLKWLAAVGNERLLQCPTEKLQHYYVCRKHFEQKFWLSKTLTVTAIPTLNLPDPINVEDVATTSNASASIDILQTEDTSLIKAETISSILLPEIVPLNVKPRMKVQVESAVVL